MPEIKLLGNIYGEQFGTGFAGNIYDADGITPAITTFQGGGREPHIVETKKVYIRQATKEGVIACEVGGVADLNYPDSKTRRGRVQGNGQICPTLTTENIPNVIEEWTWEIDGETYLIRIRKLTPRECLRLMAVRDQDIDKMFSVNSNSQCYKQAGNSIVVTVLMAIFSQLNIKGVTPWNELNQTQREELIERTT